MNVREATRSYEAWMRRCTPIVPADLRAKHALMRDDPFTLLRGMYYRWAQLWPEHCADLGNAPTVLAVGDLHVDSFGTWRDAEGRLAWGVDDFDEAYPLPYTNDLVRLATSLKMLVDDGAVDLPLRDGCDAILESYRETIRHGGRPIVLAEREQRLETLGIADLKSPEDFWKKLNALPAVRRAPPRAAVRLLRSTLPDPRAEHRFVRRSAGLGSRGQQRFVVIAQWRGGCIAREAKSMVPSASVWRDGRVTGRQVYYDRVIRTAVRSPDPFQKVVNGWLVRRLSPDANPIYVEGLTGKRDESALIGAMGAEAANVHLGTPRRARRIAADLGRRKPGWLRAAAKTMARAVERDWREYRSG